MPAAVNFCLHQQYVHAVVNQVATVQIAHTAAAAATGSAASPLHCAQQGIKMHACRCQLPTQCEASAMTHHNQLCSNSTSLTYLAHLHPAQKLIWLSVADIKTANQKHRNEQLNRTIQNFLYSLLATDNDVAAKKSLAVLTELWRRHVWRDARTVNVIGQSASDHSDLLVMHVCCCQAYTIC